MIWYWENSRSALRAAVSSGTGTSTRTAGSGSSCIVPISCKTSVTPGLVSSASSTNTFGRSPPCSNSSTSCPVAAMAAARTSSLWVLANRLIVSRSSRELKANSATTAEVLGRFGVLRVFPPAVCGRSCNSTAISPPPIRRGRTRQRAPARVPPHFHTENV